MESRVIIKKKNDNELYHWKYTRKERVNGKWRYYYDDIKDELGFDERERLMDAKRSLRRSREAMNEFNEESLKPYRKELLKTDPTWLANRKFWRKTLKRNITQDKARVDAYLKAYNRTPLGKLENTINKGKDTVKRIFNL